MTHTVVCQHQAMSEFRRLRNADPVGAKACASAVRALADDPYPAAAHELGASGYWWLPIRNWRVLYRPDGENVIVHIVKVGRVT